MRKESKCGICGKVFQSKRELRDHKDVEHRITNDKIKKLPHKKKNNNNDSSDSKWESTAEKRTLEEMASVLSTFKETKEAVKASALRELLKMYALDLHMTIYKMVRRGADDNYIHPYEHLLEKIIRVF